MMLRVKLLQRRMEERLQRPPSSLPRFGLMFAAFLSCGVTALAQQDLMQQPPPKAQARPAVPAEQLAEPSGADAQSRFRISGTVINSITKSPVAKAELTVSHMGGRRANARSTGRAGQQAAPAMTDATGHFEIEVPSAGGWSLNAAAHGYHSQALDEHEGFSTAIILTEANPTFAMTFALTPAAAIEGYVVDEAGEAVRNAQVTISLIPPSTPEDAHPRHQNRGTQRTDDRGYYKLPGLLAGNYEVRLQAQPWYATTTGRFDRLSGLAALAGSIVSGGSIHALSSASPSGSVPDPLDVVYPVLWYPGVADFAAASPITLRAGEVREADFRLSPIPGFHLRVAAAAPAADESRRPVIPNSAYLTQVLPDGSDGVVQTNVHTDALGNTDYSGLAPGTYVVHRQGESVSGSAATTTIQISPNSTRTVDLTQASLATAVTVKIDAEADVPSLQINFRDVESGRVSSVQSWQGFGARGGRRGSPVANGDATTGKDEAAQERHADRSINLQPGRYEVTLSGINDLHLASIEAKGAAAGGRTVTIGGGSPTLMLHVAAGRASVTGVVRSHGGPDAGAMVLLVPATLGDPSGLDVIRRDQTNTDGSFDILNVLPGAYILVAIDHGWDVNWRDPATLRRFLLQGTPLDLNTSGERKETVEAQLP